MMGNRRYILSQHELLFVAVQELQPDASMWLPVMPITNGELTLRPAGTIL